jgi:opacity protein-like surface antigen
MRRAVSLLIAGATAASVCSTELSAQIAITPLVGAYIPASDLEGVRSGASQGLKREGTLALGLNIEFGSLRGSLAFASGTTIKDANEADIGNGTLLAGAADLVIRPFPRIIVKPYLVAGAGFKNEKFDKTTNTNNPFPEDERKFAWHGGLGAEFMVGKFGVVGELTDFISKNDAGAYKVHDAFLNVGVRLTF